VSRVYPSAATPAVLKRETGRLIVIFQDTFIVLKFENESQFHAVAFELDHAAHFSAGVPSDNVRRPTTDAPDRL
jgi:hypothetical protein